jgi:hypothetical protein
MEDVVTTCVILHSMVAQNHRERYTGRRVKRLATEQAEFSGTDGEKLTMRLNRPLENERAARSFWTSYLNGI